MRCSKPIGIGLFAWQLVLAFAGLGNGAMGTLADGEIVGWGYNQIGQINAPAGTFTAVAAGNNHSIGLRTDGTLVGWGENLAGQVDAPAGTFTAIAAAGNYSLGLRSDGILVAWGSNSNGQLSVPAETFAAADAGFNYGLGLRTNGTLAGWGSPTTVVTSVPAGTFFAISAGDAHGLGLRSDATLIGWGDNTYGQTTVPPGAFTAIAAGGLHNVALRTDGTLAGWGSDYHAGTITPPTGQFITIAAGAEHSLGIRTDGALAGWGYNFFGQTNVPAGIFTAIAGGGNHSLALRARTDYDGDLRIFGAGTTARLNRSVQVAGDLIVESAVTRVNNAVVEVDGRLILRNFANLSDGGTYYVGGIQIENDFTLTANVTIANSGPLTGSASLVLNEGAHLDIGMAPANAFSGALSLSPSATVTLHGTGTQNAYLLGLSENSEFRMRGGQRMRLTNTAAGFGFLNSGKLEIIGSSQLGSGELDVLGRSTNSGGNALITGRDAILRFKYGINNSASIAFTGGVNDISGDIRNLTGGKITVTGGATATFYDQVLNDGTITVRKLGSSSATAFFLGGITGSGNFNGGGDILIDGDLRPGNSPATLTLDNDVTFGSEATLVIELGGTISGAEYDQIHVTGNLVLGGALDVELLTGFNPQGGQSFDILDWGSLSGAFNSIQLPTLPSSRLWNTSQLYTIGVIRVVDALAGDYGGNGVVDAADYTLWRDTLGSTTNLTADGNGNSVIDQGDYVVWKSNFGKSAAMGSGANAAVAEPTLAALLLALALSGLNLHRRSAKI